MSKFRRIKNMVPVSRLTIDDLNERQVEELRRIGRLAFRHEDKWYNCYYALPNSMEKALFIGCIPFTAVKDNRLLQEQFMALMRDTLNAIMTKQLGKPVIWKDHEIVEMK